MSSNAEKYFDALLALSGDPLFADLRENLLAKIGDEDLPKLVKHSVARNLSRQDSEFIITRVLDIVAGEEKMKEGTNGNDGGREVIKIEDDEVERNSSQVRGQDLAQPRNTHPMSPSIGPSRQGDTGSTRKRARDLDIDTEAREQPRYNTNRGYVVMPVSYPDRAPRAEASAPTTMPDIMDAPMVQDKNFRRHRSISTLTEMETPSVAPDREKFVPDIQMIVWVPDDSEGWKSMSSLPPRLSTYLQKKLNSDYNDTPGHTKVYSRMFRYRERNLETACASYYVIHRTSSKNQWDEALGNKNRTCDHCIRSKRICARLVRVHDVIHFALFPLPEQRRLDKVWTDVEYWVRG